MMAVDRVVGMSENLPIDIIANALSGQPDGYWNTERMQRVIDAAVEHGVAFEKTQAREPLLGRLSSKRRLRAPNSQLAVESST